MMPRLLLLMSLLPLRAVVVSCRWQQLHDCRMSHPAISKPRDFATELICAETAGSLLKAQQGGVSLWHVTSDLTHGTPCVARRTNKASGPSWRPRGVLVASLPDHQRPVTALCVADDHSFFVSGAEDGTIKVEIILAAAVGGGWGWGASVCVTSDGLAGGWLDCVQGSCREIELASHVPYP